jgi:hypothetical protein
METKRVTLSGAPLSLEAFKDEARTGWRVVLHRGMGRVVLHSQDLTDAPLAERASLDLLLVAAREWLVTQWVLVGRALGVADGRDETLLINVALRVAFATAYGHEDWPPAREPGESAQDWTERCRQWGRDRRAGLSGVVASDAPPGPCSCEVPGPLRRSRSEGGRDFYDFGRDRACGTCGGAVAGLLPRALSEWRTDDGTVVTYSWHDGRVVVEDARGPDGEALRLLPSELRALAGRVEEDLS